MKKKYAQKFQLKNPAKNRTLEFKKRRPWSGMEMPKKELLTG